MGMRSWAIPMSSSADAQALKRWLLNVERETGLDWGLTFWHVCKRKDGSVWALVDSDGSGCVEHLDSYGYESFDVIELTEAPEWDDKRGRLGSLAEAKYSAYLDAGAGEFFEKDSLELQAQEGLTRVFTSEDLGALWAARQSIEKLAAKREPRLLPGFGELYFRMTEAGAKPFGLCMSRLGAGFLSELRKVIGLQDMGKDTMPENVARGFTVGEDAKVAYVWKDGSRVEWPLAGSNQSEAELVAVALRNLDEAFDEQVRVKLQRLGFRWTGGASSRDGRDKNYYKRLAGKWGEFMVKADCRVRGDTMVGGSRVREVEISIAPRWGAAVQLPVGAPTPVVSGVENLEDEIKAITAAFKQLK